MTAVDFDYVPVIDCDAHVTDPPDLWTSRLPSRFQDDAPHLVLDESRGVRYWQVGKIRLATAEASGAHAGWKEHYPSVPPSLAEADPAVYDGRARLERMDEHGIYAQLLFPQILAFEIYAFLELEPDLRLACVQAYNDFLTEFASPDPKRLIPQMALPFWDIDLALVEMRRCVDMGHKAMNFGLDFEKVGLPPIRDEYWTPLLAQAQDFGLPVTFHIGFNSAKEDFEASDSLTDMRDFAMRVALFMLGNARGIAEVIMSGMCDRFPRLDFVSIESGFGYVPYLMESLDWQYLNMGGRDQFQGFKMPSEYFRRQVYASFWFEQHVDRLIDLYPDNLMFSSDFPHPTSLSPGAGSYARNARETIDANLSRIPADIRRKILSDNARRVYHLD